VQMLRTIGWMTGSSRMDFSKKSGLISNTVAQSESSDSIEVHMEPYEKSKPFNYMIFIIIIY